MAEPPIQLFNATEPQSLDEMRAEIGKAVESVKTQEAADAPESGSKLEAECVFSFSPDLADEPLKPPDLTKAGKRICAAGIYDEAQVENALVALLSGHLMLSGPPGTGKTRLAHELAEAFEAHIVPSTANPEWSVYDVIGSKTLTARGDARPKHGIITQAIIDCYEKISTSLQGQPPQATWLLIDEINRAEIDRAFGPLFTALAGRERAEYTLDYCANAPTLRVPARFRIIATLNSFDTRFVNTMSAALRRRFGRSLILPPPNEDGRSPKRELEVALDQAEERVADALGQQKAKDARTELEARGDLIRDVFGALRAPEDAEGKPAGEGVPIGTAQLIDCCEFALVLVAVHEAPADEDAFEKLLDRVLAARLTTGLESDALRGRIDRDFVERLHERFPFLDDTTDRLRAFLRGRD